MDDLQGDFTADACVSACIDNSVDCQGCVAILHPEPDDDDSGGGAELAMAPRDVAADAMAARFRLVAPNASHADPLYL
jgi:hypothetical protein